MKLTIIFFSLGGKTRLAAELLAKSLSSEIMELKTKRPYPKAYLFQLFKGGMEAMKKATPELMSYRWTEEENMILLGTPVWNGDMAPALRTFLTENSLKGRKVAAFATSLSGNAEKCFASMEQLMEHPLEAKLSLRSQKAGFPPEEIGKLEMFAKKIKERAE